MRFAIIAGLLAGAFIYFAIVLASRGHYGWCALYVVSATIHSLISVYEIAKGAR